MLREYIAINRLIRTLISEITEIYFQNSQTNSPDLSEVRKNILGILWELREYLPQDLDQINLDKDFEFIGDLKENDVDNLGLRALYVVSDVLEQIEIYYSNKSEPENSNDILDFLHPIVIESSYKQFLDGHYRDAVLDAFIAVFNYLEQRTKLKLDGVKLAQTAFSSESPVLVVSTLHTKSGRSEQIGFMNLLTGAYLSIRNPKAHSLLEKPSRSIAVQNLIFASFLAKRIEEAKDPSEDRPEDQK